MVLKFTFDSTRLRRPPPPFPLNGQEGRLGFTTRTFLRKPAGGCLKPARKSPTPDFLPFRSSPPQGKRCELLQGQLPSGQVTLKEFIPFLRMRAREAWGPLQYHHHSSCFAWLLSSAWNSVPRSRCGIQRDALSPEAWRKGSPGMS